MKRRTQLFLLFFGLTLLLTSCTGNSRQTKSACCSEEVTTLSKSNSPALLSDASLYQIDSVWTNDSGNAVQLSDLRGQPQIVTMFFASCEYACPILVHDMRRIEKELPAELRAKTGFTLVSFDTERDTPQALNKYRANQHLADNWNLLSGSSDDVLELAALLGVKFKKDARGQFAHSNVITVLDSKGEIVFQQIGLNQDPQHTVAVLKKLF